MGTVCFAILNINNPIRYFTNVKSTTKGHQKRLENATPIYNLQDEKIN